MSDPLDLAPIRARAEAATGGPWRLQTAACDHPDADSHSAIKGAGALVVACAEDADAAFIAAARMDVPTLCDEVARLRGEIAEADATGKRQAVARIRAFADTETILGDRERATLRLIARMMERESE